MTLSESTIARIFPNSLPTALELDTKYPRRKLSLDARVTRFAPSPTGFLHIGGVMTALISERLAHQSAGIFLLRLEDTDQKREVEGAKDLILKSLRYFGIYHDEGPTLEGGEKGEYAPYTQSMRKDLYQTYIKELLRKGDAYVCFATPVELEQNIEKQKAFKEPLGYWGPYALWRERSEEDVLACLNEDKSYVIRLKSPGVRDRKIRIKDHIRGNLEFPENINDVVIMKGDGLPTYHFAHAVDDYLMGTTHVVRSDEWLPSLPMHVQLFEVLGFPVPTYCHVAPIQKMEDTSRRKLSKRKDPEANVEYYIEQGYPARAVIEYVLNLANSKFEDWRRAHPMLPYTSYMFDPKNINNSGCLLDFVKLHSVSSGVIAKMTLDELWNELTLWAKVYDTEFYEKLIQHSELSRGFLNIDRDMAKKDIARWSEVRGMMEFLYKDWFAAKEINYKELLGVQDMDDAREVLEQFIKDYDSSWTQEVWLQRVKDMAETLGYAASPKDLKTAPEGTYKGHFGALAMVIRIAITGSTRSPELSKVMALLGKEEAEVRMRNMLDSL